MWVSGSELEWAKCAWASLAKHDLTAFDGEVERTMVLLRLLTLAVLYREWCWLARDEPLPGGDIVGMATEDAEICPFRVAQLVGPEFGVSAPDSDQAQLLAEALSELTTQERPTLCRILIKCFGSAAALHQALDATTNTDCEDDPDECPQVELGASRAIGWILEGMPEL